jgi:pyruvate formate lyase activating enzyme
MSQLGTLEAGTHHDLHIGLSPDAPEGDQFRDEAEGAFGYAAASASSQT